MKVKYVGGPLHGQQYAPRTKPPLYLSDQGVPITPRAGDRVFSRNDLHPNVKHHSGYRLERFPKGEVAYIHSSTVSAQRYTLPVL